MGFWSHWCHRHARPPKLPDADMSGIRVAVRRLRRLQPKQKEQDSVSEPTGLVQIAQSDLDNLATELSTIAGVLGPYIQQLIAGQATPLSDADESAINAAVTALQNLEPPAPAPAPE